MLALMRFQDLFDEQTSSLLRFLNERRAKVDNVSHGQSVGHSWTSDTLRLSTPQKSCLF